MKGFKVFNNDWTCRGFQFEVGKVFEENITPKFCRRGFHFCKELTDCFNYYNFDINNKVAEVEALGKIDSGDENTKFCTNKIYIIRELTWHEVLDLVNTGSSNTGIGNTGGFNSGNHNSGNHNCGSRNSGSYNEGDMNVGIYNTGNYNTGDHNSGYWNSGDRNSGVKNRGNHNSGDNNSGNYNSGNYNTGHCNSGNHNSGDYNSGHCNTGCFNTETPKITMFNKPCDWTLSDWMKSKANTILNRMLFNSDRQAWWDNLPYRDKNIVMKLPNFDKEIFEKITGIKIGDKTRDKTNNGEPILILFNKIK